MKKPHVSVVIPLYNEKESLTELVNQVQRALGDIRGGFEFVFVDDGSTDGSFNLFVRLKQQTKTGFTVIRFRKNLGKSAALSVGFGRARGDVIVTMDADLQDEASEIPKLISKLEEGYDLVVGWREKRNDREGKIRLSKIFNTIVSRVTHVHLHDMNCGLKAMKRSVIEEIDLYGELHRFIPVLAATKGFQVGEVSVVHHARKYGISKFGRARIFRASFDLVTTMFLTSFKHRPLHIFGPLGVSSVLCGLVTLVYLSYLHFLGQSIGRRPLLFLGILFILFGVQLFSTGLLGELVTSSNARKDAYPIEKIVE